MSRQQRSAANSLGGSAAVKLTNPEDFEAVFNLLGPCQTRKLKLQVPDTVFLSSDSEYVAITSIVSTKAEVVHKWHPRKVTMKSVWELARKWALRASSEHEPVAVARYLNASYLLDANLLDDLIQKITGDTFGILGESTEAPPELDISSMELQTRQDNFYGGIPFCIQSYTSAFQDRRLVASFQWSDVSVVCETYLTPYSETYTHMHKMLAAREASNLEGKGLAKKKRAKLQPLSDMDSHRLRQMTLATVNYIHRAHKFQMLGLVVEVIEDKDSCLWLNSILGLCWPEEWARRNVLRPDALMAVDMPSSVKATILGKKVNPGSLSNDLTRSTVPAKNSNRDVLDDGPILMDSGSMPKIEKPKFTYREPWQGPGPGKPLASMSVDLPASPKTQEMASPRKVRLKQIKANGAAEGEEKREMEAVPPLPIKGILRDTKMHVTSLGAQQHQQQENQQGFLYRHKVAESDPGVQQRKPERLDSNFAESLQGSVTDREGFKQPKPGGIYGLNSDVAMLLSPRYTQEGLWGARSGMHGSSQAQTALAASAAALTSLGKAPPSFALSHSSEKVLGKDQGRGVALGDVTSRLIRRVEELRQALQEQSQEASAARVMELHASAKQRDAERDRDVAVAALQELEQKYRDYEHDTLHDLQALRKDCLQAETDASHLQVSLREMTDQYEKAQARLTKEREVAFQITTDLKDELDRVKAEVDNLRASMQGVINNSESNRDFAESELQEERARARTLGKQVKILEETRDSLEADLQEVQEKKKKVQLEKDTVLRAIPELHIVMKSMLEGHHAQIGRREVQNLLPHPDLDIDVEHTNINKVLGSNSLTIRQIFQYYAGTTGPSSRRGRILSMSDFVRLCRDIGLMESQLDKARAMSVLTADTKGSKNWSNAKRLIKERLSVSNPALAAQMAKNAEQAQEPKTENPPSKPLQSKPLSPTKVRLQPEGTDQGESKPKPEFAVGLMSVFAESFNIEDVGDLKSLETKHLKTMDAEHIFMVCISQKGGRKDNERFMELQGFAHSLVRVAALRYPKVHSLASRVLALWFQCLGPGAKRVDLANLLTSDRETKRGQGLLLNEFEGFGSLGVPSKLTRKISSKKLKKRKSQLNMNKARDLLLGFSLSKQGNSSKTNSHETSFKASSEEKQDFLKGIGVAVPSHLSGAATAGS